MKANKQSSREYLGKIGFWLSADNPREQVIFQWLQEQEATGVKIAPLIKDVLYNYITGQTNDVASQLEALRGDIRRAIQSGRLTYNGDEPAAEEADDLMATLGGMQT